MCMSATPTPTPPGRVEPIANGDDVGPMQLTEVRGCIDRMWQGEPNAAPSVRSRLLEQLAQLDHDVELLMLRTNQDDEVDDWQVRACADRVTELMGWWYRPDDDQRPQFGAIAPDSAA